MNVTYGAASPLGHYHAHTAPTHTAKAHTAKARTACAAIARALCVMGAFAACATATEGGSPAPATLALTWDVAKAYSGIAFRLAPEVTVQTSAGQVVVQSGTTVEARVLSGTGLLIGNPRAVTRADGRAIFTDLGLRGTGPVVLQFFADGLPAVTASAVVLTEQPIALIVAAQPFFVPSGGTLSALQVFPRDVYGDNTGEQGLVVSASVASGSGTLSGTTSVPTDVHGVARFSSMSIVGFGPHTLRFSAAGLQAPVSQSINVEQRATSLSLVVQPSGVTSGLVFRTQPRVQLRDAQGAAVSQRNVLVTVDLASGTGTMYGTRTATTNDQGLAVFADLSIAGTGSHTLRFESAGLAGVVSEAVVLPPFELAFGLDQFALIRGGTFQMGSEVGFGNERPVHRVTIARDYYLQRTEVSQAQFGAVMGRNPSVFVSCGGECPVENITLAEIDEFLRRLNTANPGVTFRLPTEAEWEFAAQAGGNGDDPLLVTTQAWHAGNSGGRTQPVAKRPANAWGLYDMLGNVAEWVSDWYEDYPSGPVTDPLGPPNGTQKVQRGGSWNVPAALIRVPARQFAEPTDPQFAVRSTLGLRLVRNR